MGITLEELLLELQEFKSTALYWAECSAIDQSKIEALISEVESRLRGMLEICRERKRPS